MVRSASPLKLRSPSQHEDTRDIHRHETRGEERVCKVVVGEEVMREELVVYRRTFVCEVPPGVQSGGGWRQGAHTPVPLHTLSARASVTTNSSPPAASYSCRLSASYSCQLTVSVSDSSPPLSVGASARGDDTRGGGGEGCGGAAAAAAPSSLAASLRAGSCCCQTTPPARPQLAANSMCCEKPVSRLDPPRVCEHTTHLSFPYPARPELEQLLGRVVST